MEIHVFLIIALTAAIAGISLKYVIQAVVNNDMDMMGLNQDKQTFFISLGSSGLAVTSDLLFYLENSMYSAVAGIALLVLWIISLIVYFIREDHVSLGALGVELKVPGKFNRNRDITRGVTLVALSSAIVLSHILGKSFED